MRQLSTVVLSCSTVRHLASNKESPLRYGDRHVTLCGLDARQHAGMVVLDGDRKTLGYPLCKTCARARRAHDADQIIPEPNDAATRRAEAMDAPVQEVPARVYRVQGSTDTYTVTVPNSEHLATLCNCMAGKVHPEKECKHAATVRMVTGTTMGATA